RRVPVAGRPAGGGVGGDLSDAPYARHTVELPDGGRARGRAPAASPGRPRRPRRRFPRARDAVRAAPDGASPGRPRARPEPDAAAAGPGPARATVRAAARHARPDG